MCGILVQRLAENVDELKFKKALDKIAHRGPDASGISSTAAGNIYLGHRRLSIIDLSTNANQPMKVDSERLQIVFNGEIYNFKELKKYLDSKFPKIQWNSVSDTEVLLMGYKLLGSPFFSKLNGMFSFVIYDGYKDELIFQRDPIGIKPLYIYSRKDELILSSELSAIKALLKETDLTIRKESLYDQAMFTFVPEPNTMFNEIIHASPGVIYSYSANGILSEEVSFQSTKLSKKRHVARVKTFDYYLNKSIERQVNADVPITSLLSGGLDSSLLTSIASKHVDLTEVFTLSINGKDNSEDGQTDDLYYAKLLAEDLKTRINVTEADENFIDRIDEILPCLEDGIADPAAIALYVLCEEIAKKGYKVVLLGQGPDEYLKGYRRHKAHKLSSYFPFVLIRILSPVIMKIPDMSGVLNPLIRRAKYLALRSRLSEKERVKSYYMWNLPHEISKIYNLPKPYNNNELNSIVKDDSQNFSDCMDKADKELDLKSLNLHYSDRICMKFGIEGRVPYLDSELVSYMESLKDRDKMLLFESKYILKKVAEKYISKSVIYRKKSGFGLPIRSWIKNRESLVRQVLNQEQLDLLEIYNNRHIADMISDTVNGKKDYSYTLWILMIQVKWLQHNKYKIC